MTDLVDARRAVLPASVVDVLRANADRDPDAPAFGFLRYPGGAEDGIAEWLTTGELDRRAAAVAAALGAYAGRGDRVLVLLPPGLDFLVGLAGAFYAGTAAVACPPPVAGPGDPRTERAVQIAADADVAVVLTTASLAAGLRPRWAELGGDVSAPWLALDEVPAAPAGTALPEVTGDDVALLQYTSGSTGRPKGVVVPHGHLVAQLDQTRALAGLPDGSSVVSWISVYHALGVAGHLLLSQYVGGRALFCTPEDFAAAPIRWLRAISSMPGPVFSCAPNFAFERAVDLTTPAQRAGLDLSGWHTTFNAAERVRAATIARFTGTFAPYGFRPATMAPGFGMTETMLFMTGRHADPEPLVVTAAADALERGEVRPAAAGERSVPLVGVGPAGPHCRVLVVDPQTRRVLGEDRVGEVWIDGPIVCPGYWRRDAETEETFGARTDTGEGPFLRTGDLGFLHGGDLVLCGRHKEMIIIRGRNLYPQDVEMSCERVHPVLAGAPAAAFSVEPADGPDGAGEVLVMVQSVDPAAAREAGLDLDELARSLRAAITGDHEVEVHEVLVVAPDQVSRTVSGKVQRRMCRQRYLDGALVPLAVSITENVPVAAPDLAPLRGMLLALDPELRAPVLVAELRRRLAALLGAPPAAVRTDRPLAGLGLESLRAIELRRALERDLEVTVPMADFLRGSVDELAATIAAGLAAAPSAAPSAAPPADPAATPWRPLVADPEHRGEPFPLTEQQHAYFVGRSSGYDLGGVSIHLYVEIDVPPVDGVPGVDTDRLRSALDRLVARQEMLRAVVRSDGTQQILPATEVPPVELPVADLSTADDGTLATHLEKTCDELSHQVLPLDSWPMFEVRATRLPAGVTRVHVSIDLLVADLASIRLFFLEWGDLYADDSPLPPPAVSFRDYVLALDRVAGSPAREAARAYWLERIPTLPPGPDLPTVSGGDRTRRVGRRAQLDAERWRRLRDQGARRGLTPSAVLLAAYSAVLARWSRTGRFTLNVPLFNRLPLHPEIDTVVGDFTAVTLLEVDATSGGVAGIGARLQRQLGRDLDHRAFSGVEVMRELTRQRGVPAGTFATVAFASGREQGRDPDGRQGSLGSAWLGEPSYLLSQTPQVLLDHQVYENDGVLAYNWDAVEGLFPTGLLDDMFAAYTTVLERLAAGDEAWEPAGLDVLPGWQRELVAEANDTAGPVPDGLLVDGLLGWAASEPGRPAVVAGDACLSYGELVGRASVLGRELRAAGVRPGELVAVAVPKSAAQVVAAVGVLLAGGAYLPVDPDLPARRRDQLLDQGRVRIVLTAAGGGAGGWPATVDVVEVDATAPVGAAEPLVPVQGPEDVAYVIFTSGSTGTPKGVVLTHRAVLNTLDEVSARFGVGAGDAVLGLSSLSFDLSVYDVFGVLGAGGRLVLPPPGSSRDPETWAALVAEHGVTVWNSVPALCQMLVDAEAARGEPSGALAGLRVVLLSGDWIPVSLPERVRALAPGCRVVSLGGATEAAVWSIAHPVEVVDPGRDSIPYGRPLRNQSFHVLDDRWQECPVWTAGELFIGGVGLAQGYWRDPERTAASFVTSPLSGERLYRTGDLGRWLPDGTIEFLGREDFQVKIGGYRIELGEIETTLTRHPQVRDAAVVATGPDRQRRQLAAFVVAADPAPAGAGPAPDLSSDPAPDPSPDPAEKRLLGDVVTDPVERLEFAARRPALRSDLDGAAVSLPDTVAGADEVWARRASSRSFGAEPVPLADLAALLEPLRSREGPVLPKYRYGSAGSLYPVQTYLWVRPGRVDGLAGGSYYYDPAGHRLAPVRVGADLDAALHVSTNAAAFAGCAFELFLVGRAAAVEPLYGARSRHFCLLEAGLMTQLLEDAAAATGLGLCQVGLLRDEAPLAGLLGLQPGDALLHSLVGGARPHGAASPGPAPAAGAEPLPDRLRAWLADRLPQYMVPASIAVVDDLPLAATGKVDRRELARRGETAPAQRAEARIAPGSELERAIADTVGRVLGLDRVGVTDSFFDLGADSVAVVRIYRLLRAELGREFPLMRMFEHPSVRRLALSFTGTAGSTATGAAFDAAARRRAGRIDRRGRTTPAGEDGQ